MCNEAPTSQLAATANTKSAGALQKLKGVAGQSRRSLSDVVGKLKSKKTSTASEIATATGTSASQSIVQEE